MACVAPCAINLHAGMAETSSRRVGAQRSECRMTCVRVPSSLEAGGFVRVDNFGPHSKLETVLVTVEVRENTFALRVHGESMRGNGANSFPPGTIVVVEPAMKARPGDFVIVLNRSKQATFKQLDLIDGVSYLKPLNKRFKTRRLGDGVIIGVVREAIWRLQ